MKELLLGPGEIAWLEPETPEEARFLEERMDKSWPEICREAFNLGMIKVADDSVR